MKLIFVMGYIKVMVESNGKTVEIGDLPSRLFMASHQISYKPIIVYGTKR